MQVRWREVQMQLGEFKNLFYMRNNVILVYSKIYMSL